MPAKPAVEPIVEQPPLSRRHDSKLSLSQHRAYLLAVDALGVLDVRQPCAGHYVVEATYVATERIEESTSHEVSPNVDEVLASGVRSLPTQTMHMDALVAEFAACITRAMATVGDHPDLVGFFPPEHKDLLCFTDVKKTKQFVVNEKYVYECWGRMKRSMRNSLLPVFMDVGRKLGQIPSRVPRHLQRSSFPRG